MDKCQEQLSSLPDPKKPSIYDPLLPYSPPIFPCHLPLLNSYSGSRLKPNSCPPPSASLAIPSIRPLLHCSRHSPFVPCSLHAHFSSFVRQGHFVEVLFLIPFSGIRQRPHETSFGILATSERLEMLHILCPFDSEFLQQKNSFFL